MKIPSHTIKLIKPIIKKEPLLKLLPAISAEPVKKVGLWNRWWGKK